MEWQISPRSRVSSWSQQPFEAGDTVVTYLLLVKGGLIERLDLHEAEEAAAPGRVSGEVIGRWKRVLKPPSNDREAQAERLQTAEDLFLSLFESETEASGDGAGAGTRDALKHLLGLHLERKKLLKPVGRRRHAGGQRYLHTKLGREFEVPVLPLDSGLVGRVMPVIDELTW